MGKEEPMRLEIVLGEGEEHLEGMEGFATLEAMRKVFEKCLQLQYRKGFTYGRTWQDQGYMGNVGRVLGKVSRLRNMVWRDSQIESSEESRMDTLGDLINIAAFAIINMENDNKWGNDVRH